MSRNLYLGRPGTSLVAISRRPAPGMSRTSDMAAQVHRTLSGSYAVDRSPRGARTWQMSWNWLSDDERRDIAALFHGQYGPGPYALLDPAQTNYLTSQQASGTDKTQDTSGFSVSGGETLASSTAQAVRGSRSLKWSLPASVTSGILTLSAPPSLSAWATPAGESWAFSGQLQGGGSDPTVSVQLSLQWQDASLAQISETLGSAVTIGSGAWSSLVVTGTPPTNAVYFTPRVKVSAASVTATADVYLDSLQLERNTVASNWTPGEGLPLVSITQMPESVPLVGRRDMSLTLVEVG